jgi:hypothetical protein
VEPALRAQAEQVLHAGESLSSFVESAVRAGVAQRLARQEFIARGLAALEASCAQDDYVTADECVARLRDKLKRARGADAHSAGSR